LADIRDEPGAVGTSRKTGGLKQIYATTRLKNAANTLATSKLISFTPPKHQQVIFMRNLSRHHFLPHQTTQLTPPHWHQTTATYNANKIKTFGIKLHDDQPKPHLQPPFSTHTAFLH